MAETTTDTVVEAPPLPGTELLPDLKYEMVTYQEADQDEKKLVESASNFLSGFTNMAGLVTLPRRGATVLRQIEFLPLSDKRVLVIIVVNEKNVQNKILTLDRDYTADELQTFANFLNEQKFTRCNV